MLALTAALALSGCTKKVYIKSGASTNEHTTAFAECQQQSEFLPRQDSPPAVRRDSGAGAILGNAIADAVANTLRTAEFMDQCMSAKGWQTSFVENAPAKKAAGSAADMLVPTKYKSSFIKIAEREATINLDVECKSAPNIEAKPIARVRQGDTVIVSETDGVWSLVRTRDGATGYLAEKWISYRK
ncbi:MAG: SH3 domain-containing protein [Alphaproteobacteria bacterium]|nr:SH3 domain-containing protein [Alphaproteobacteria bacterium]MBF0394484.1 SH3 domain-containing protein [Alphaproteobacteria bacterium]